MSELNEEIAGRLERAFTMRGFAEPGVADLRKEADVSLRTLYRYFPSREAMVVGALEHRHRRYLDFLTEGAPPPGREAVLHLFDRLQAWMATLEAPTCLFLSALSAHPENDEIRRTVARHKRETRVLIARQAGRPDIGDVLFLLHEGATAAWPTLGPKALDDARAAASNLMMEDES